MEEIIRRVIILITLLRDTFVLPEIYEISPTTLFAQFIIARSIKGLPTTTFLVLEITFYYEIHLSEIFDDCKTNICNQWIFFIRLT